MSKGFTISQQSYTQDQHSTNIGSLELSHINIIHQAHQNSNNVEGMGETLSSKFLPVVFVSKVKNVYYDSSSDEEDSAGREIP
jgi:hypothetical protein